MKKLFFCITISLHSLYGLHIKDPYFSDFLIKAPVTVELHKGSFIRVSSDLRPGFDYAMCVVGIGNGLSLQQGGIVVSKSKTPMDSNLLSSLFYESCFYLEWGFEKKLEGALKQLENKRNPNIPYNFLQVPELRKGFIMHPYDLGNNPIGQDEEIEQKEVQLKLVGFMVPLQKSLYELAYYYGYFSFCTKYVNRINRWWLNKEKEYVESETKKVKESLNLPLLIPELFSKSIMRKMGGILDGKEVVDTFNTWSRHPHFSALVYRHIALYIRDAIVCSEVDPKNCMSDIYHLYEKIEKEKINWHRDKDIYQIMVDTVIWNLNQKLFHNDHPAFEKCIDFFVSRNDGSKALQKMVKDHQDRFFVPYIKQQARVVLMRELLHKMLTHSNMAVVSHDILKKEIVGRWEPSIEFSNYFASTMSEMDSSSDYLSN